MRRLLVSATLLAALTGPAADARADEASSLRLTWSAPTGCPSGDAVREAALRGAEGRAAVAPLEVRAVVERAGRWRVTLRARRDGVEFARHLEGATCAALADATAVVLALAMMPPSTAPEEPEKGPGPGSGPEPGLGSGGARPSSAAQAPAPAAASAAVVPPAAPPAPPPGSARATPATPAPVATPAPPAIPATPATPAPAAVIDLVRARPESDGSRSDNTRRSFAIGASFATDAASLPAPAAGGALTLAWIAGRARVELAGATYAGQEQTTRASGAGASFGLVTAGVRGCFAVVRAAVEVAPCAGADVAFLSAKGFGAAENYVASARWVNAAAGLQVRVPVATWMALRVQGDAVLSVTRPRFVVENEGVVHSPSPLGVRGLAGIELPFS